MNERFNESEKELPVCFCLPSVLKVKYSDVKAEFVYLLVYDMLVYDGIMLCLGLSHLYCSARESEIDCLGSSRLL